MTLASLLRIVWLLAGAYALFVAFVYLRQGSLLYFPTKLGDAQAAALANGSALVRWPATAARGYLREPVSGPAVATVVVFHGNAGHAIDRDFYADALVPLGYRVLLAEYPGYGERSGTPTEADLVADAVATLAEVRARYPGPVVAWGESLGAGVVAGAVAERPGIANAIVLLTPWDSLASVASHHYGALLPVRWLLRERYDSVQNLRAFPGPIAVLVAGDDRTIPPEFGRRLHAALAGPTMLHVFTGADHNSWPADPAHGWWREVMAFAVAPR